MALIDDESKKTLKERFEKELAGDVSVIVFSTRINATPEQIEYAEFTQTLFKEISEISPRVKVSESTLLEEKALEYGIKTNPSVMIGEDKGYKIIFSGAPAGYEVMSVVETLILVSRGESGLSGESAGKITSSSGTARVQVFVTPTCPYCPRAVILSHRVAIASAGRIVSECVEAEENPQLSREFNVSAVPQQVINADTKSVTVGVQSEPEFVDQVVQHLK